MTPIELLYSLYLGVGGTALQMGLRTLGWRDYPRLED